MPELEQKTFQKRQIAYKIRISDILNSNFAKDELSAGYIKLNDINISRVNIIGTLVYKSEGQSYASSIIDDASGKVSLRSFNNIGAFSKIDVGDVILVIGKIREFNNEKYIMPETLKKTEIGWMNVRNLELKNNKIVDENKKSEEIIVDNDDEIYSLIKNLDKGDGVSFEDIIKNSAASKAEIIITRLLENGDVFEIKPGKLKVLE